MPPTPEELKVDNRKMPRTGNLIIGTKGKILITGDYADSPRLIPESKQKEFGKPKKLLERSPGHHEEFIMACKGQKPREFSRSNFGYAGPMTANVQLGNLCARAGKKLELDEQGQITNDPAVNDLAWREPRKGWGAAGNEKVSRPCGNAGVDSLLVAAWTESRLPKSSRLRKSLRFPAASGENVGATNSATSENPARMCIDII